jgi:hypothetical protein
VPHYAAARFKLKLFVIRVVFVVIVFGGTVPYMQRFTGVAQRGWFDTSRIGRISTQRQHGSAAACLAGFNESILSLVCSRSVELPHLLDGVA